MLLADGTVPPSVYFDMSSGSGGHRVFQWDVYDGHTGQTPRAAALHA